MAHRVFRRRDFLRLTVVSAMVPLTGPLTGCSSDGKPAVGGATGPFPDSPDADALRVFPQGVASGDPRPDSIILWTRVETDSKDDVTVGYQMATDAKFGTIVASGDVTALASADHTVRLKVTDLDPYQTYYYRFRANDVSGVVGRTKTAPAEDADVPVKFAFAACQDFVGRYYHAWKALNAEDDVDFVLHLGDYIYETSGDPNFQTPTEDRKIVLPDGLDIGGSGLAAKTLADYRSLYKQYRTDEHLREAHALFPFITIWDDHEFGDDCWGDHNTHFSGAQGDEEDPVQRKDADQAWFEYQPMDVVYDGEASFPEDIKIYRKLRYGQHLELFMTDERYYRDDHVIPEGPVDLDVAKITENSSIGSRIFVLKSGFDPKEAAKNPTMLGKDQKKWFVDAVKASEATWKVWGNEVQLAQMVADLSAFPKVPEQFRSNMYLTVDQWDGYRTERAEILDALKDVSNLVALTGDIHAFYASELHVDFDAPDSKPVAVEYVTAGVTSQAIAPAAESVIGGNDLFKSLGLLELIPQWDTLLTEASPHYRYANSFVNGIAKCNLTKDAIEVEFLVVDDVTKPDADGVVDRPKFRTASGSNTIETL